jgi:hypothetical protein
MIKIIAIWLLFTIAIVGIIQWVKATEFSQVLKLIRFSCYIITCAALAAFSLFLIVNIF